MKQCPKCQQVYADDNLNFCLNDGASLSTPASAASTLIMSPGLAASSGPSGFESLPEATKRTKPFHLYIAIALLALTVCGAFLLWLSAHTALPKNTTSPAATNVSQSKDEPKKKPEISSDWIFLTQASDGRIRVYYSWQGRTFKLKFANDDATAEIKYKVRADLKVKGEWESEDWHEATVTVKKGEQQLDNWPLPSATEEIRNVEVEIIDWNYK